MEQVTPDHQTHTRQRVARRVRITAREKGVSKTALRDALGFVDWRPINTRWHGDREYSVLQLMTVADRLGVSTEYLLAGADPEEEKG
jgi:hypothetical protein